jgi:hypothetical protein
MLRTKKKHNFFTLSKRIFDITRVIKVTTYEHVIFINFSFKCYPLSHCKWCHKENFPR